MNLSRLYWTYVRSFPHARIRLSSDGTHTRTLQIESNKAQLDAACKERDERRNEAAELQEEALIAAKERDNILKEIETLLPAEQVEEIRSTAPWIYLHLICA